MTQATEERGTTARRWEPRYARRDLTLANVFTAARLVLVPVFGYLWSTGQNERALWVFCVAGVTDLLDGFFARWLNQRSRLGALLDPIADKLLMLVSLVVGMKLGAIPAWYGALVIARDSLLGVGALLFATRWKDRHGPSAWRPTRVGKYAMAMQSVTIVLVIVDTTLAPLGLRSYLESIMVLTAALTVCSFAQYTLRAARAVRAARVTEGEP